MKKRSSKKRSTKKRSSKKRSTKKRSSKKRSVRSRHSKTNSSVNDRRANRPSPSTGASSQKIGTTMKGNDGNMYKVVKTVNGTRRWAKV
jgi:serine/arginine repetitive matrix protein 2